jgi:hypothetical protein
MSREEEEHIAFITVDGLFCYVSMPYGLKNAFPTFVCAMHKTFRDLIRDLVEVNVDNIIVKIKSHSSLLDNHAIVLDRLRSMRTMLNPDKCVFRVCWKSALLPGFASGNRGQPREDQGNQRDAAANPHQVCPEAHGMLGCAQLVYL